MMVIDSKGLEYNNWMFIFFLRDALFLLTFFDNIIHAEI